MNREETNSEHFSRMIIEFRKSNYINFTHFLDHMEKIGKSDKLVTNKKVKERKKEHKKKIILIKR